jgi:hypothetical protein
MPLLRSGRWDDPINGIYARVSETPKNDTAGDEETPRRSFAYASPPNGRERDALRENSTVIWTMKGRWMKGRSLS